MTEDAGRACEACQWWVRIALEQRGRTYSRTNNGWCKHSPPTATGERGKGKWPIVSANEWCGQWQEKPDG